MSIFEGSQKVRDAFVNVYSLDGRNLTGWPHFDRDSADGVKRSNGCVYRINVKVKRDET